MALIMAGYKANVFDGANIIVFGETSGFAVGTDTLTGTSTGYTSAVINCIDKTQVNLTYTGGSRYVVSHDGTFTEVADATQYDVTNYDYFLLRSISGGSYTIAVQ